MGTFNWPLWISGMNSGSSREIEATGDTGVAYATLPACCVSWGLNPRASAGFFWPTGGGSIWMQAEPG